MVYCFGYGFSDWRHPERAVSDHEKSANHRHSMLALLRKSKNVGTVDALLRQQTDAEGKYWKEVQLNFQVRGRTFVLIK